MKNDIPIVLSDFLNYLTGIKSSSDLTVKEYSYDLSNFLKFILIRKKNIKGIAFNEVDISDFDSSVINDIALQDLHAYIAFVNSSGGNSSATRFRKVASIKAFFKYLYEKMKLIDHNPAYELEYPKLDQRLPVYLTLNDTHKLLNTVSNDSNIFLKARDFAIMMLFLNCGMRLSELTSINVNDIREDKSINIIGKGNKERTVFLNNATFGALNEYLCIRPDSKTLNDPEALFISQKKNRMSNRAVQYMIEKRILEAGLDPNTYTVHKLRHTAATLMYKYGDVDIMTLKEILGHSNVATTQIYTHVDTDIIKSATEKNPLSEFEPD